MARFDVYPNPFSDERRHTPFVLDVQNNHLGPMLSRVVIPLKSASVVGRPVRDLNPLLRVGGKELVLDTANLAAVHVSMLKSPVENIAGQRSDVLGALDTLFGSF